MLDEKIRSELDEKTIAMIVANVKKEILPALCWSLFLAYRIEGFTKKQAFELVNSYVLSHNPDGTKAT